MNLKNEIFLVKKFPKLLKNYWKSPEETVFTFGFECGDGWFLLIHDLLKELSEYDGVVIEQIKEKFGYLSVYVSGLNQHNCNDVFDIIKKYKTKSRNVCEVCGEKGSLVKGSWLKTLCDSCKNKL